VAARHTAFDEDTVVLTGSSAVDLEEARKQLAHRRGPAADSDRILRPMSFRSFCGCMQTSAPLDAPVVPPADFQPGAEAALDALLPWLDELAGLWDLFLLCGGFPRAVAEQLQTGSVSRAFTNGLWDVIAGDAFKRSRITAAQAEALLKRLVLGTGSLTNLSQLAEDMGAATTTPRSRGSTISSPLSSRGVPPRRQPQRPGARCPGQGVLR
jgi:predicted AAA+ superfamily ATPase